MLGMCYFLTSYFPSSSEGCIFVGKWEWGHEVVGEGPQGHSGQATPRIGKLGLLPESGFQSPERISPLGASSPVLVRTMEGT